MEIYLWRECSKGSSQKLALPKYSRPTHPVPNMLYTVSVNSFFQSFFKSPFLQYLHFLIGKMWWNQLTYPLTCHNCNAGHHQYSPNIPNFPVSGQVIGPYLSPTSLHQPNLRTIIATVRGNIKNTSKTLQRLSCHIHNLSFSNPIRTGLFEHI